MTKSELKNLIKECIREELNKSSEAKRIKEGIEDSQYLDSTQESVDKVFSKLQRDGEVMIGVDPDYERDNGMDPFITLFKKIDTVDALGNPCTFYITVGIDEVGDIGSDFQGFFNNEADVKENITSFITDWGHASYIEE